MPVPSVKTCSDCGIEKPIDKFSVTNKATGARRNQCNSCKHERNAKAAEVRRSREADKPAFRCCTKCGIEKPLDSSNFKTRKTSAFGLTPECKSCLQERNKEWLKTDAGKALRKRLEPRYAEWRADYAKRYQSANRERINQYVRDWRQKNIEHRRSLDAAWARKNKAKRAEYRHARRAAGSFSYSVIDELKSLQKGKCATCRKFLSSLVEIDHIMPIALGGTNERTNLQLLCRHCNRSKGAKHPVEFMQSRGFLL